MHVTFDPTLDNIVINNDNDIISDSSLGLVHTFPTQTTHWVSKQLLTNWRRRYKYPPKQLCSFPSPCRRNTGHTSS